ncbi:hypothetical protein U27_03651 [Candidatus Vecturithrix granuli]|uniref:DUF1573 domain-containing protein n=1 Tax=Vecturithrix granuli TaxID=1499967 RepID=A0A081BWI3_VECG1|nr:hypothetical protein U27_03651 [Candidatus Vecturithrix granuli]
MKVIHFCKYLLIVVLSVGGGLTTHAAPQITFEETTFDYGDVQADSTITHIFVFRNTGDEPLIIESLQSL